MPTKRRRRYSLLIAFAWLLPLFAFVLAFLWAPNWPPVRYVNHYLVHFMFLAFGVGFLGIIFRNNTVMVSAFVLCSAMCLFLKARSSGVIPTPLKTNSPIYKVMHVNVSAVPDTGVLFRYIRELNPDILTFQELSPDWYQMLHQHLDSAYRYHVDHSFFDLYSMSIFAQNPLLQSDTLRVNRSSWLSAQCVLSSKDTCDLLLAYMLPREMLSSDKEIDEQLNQIGRFVNSSRLPVLLLGDLNLVPWSNELLRLRQISGLTDSRQPNMPPFQTEGSVFDVPIDYIYYSSAWNCPVFKDIPGGKNGHLGVLGCYQLNKSTSIAKKNN